MFYNFDPPRHNIITRFSADGSQGVGTTDHEVCAFRWFAARQSRVYIFSRLLKTSTMFVFTPFCNGAAGPKLGVYLNWLSLTYLL